MVLETYPLRFLAIIYDLFDNGNVSIRENAKCVIWGLKAVFNCTQGTCLRSTINILSGGMSGADKDTYPDCQKPWPDKDKNGNSDTSNSDTDKRSPDTECPLRLADDPCHDVAQAGTKSVRVVLQCGWKED